MADQPTRLRTSQAGLELISEVVRRRLLGVLAGLLLLGSSACAPFVQYSDQLWAGREERSQFVQVPSRVGGGLVGALVGIPSAIVASPFTYGLYLVEKEQAPLRADLPSTLGAPAFFFWRLGTVVLGTPFDTVEYAVWRAWQDPPTPTRAEREKIEREIDREHFVSYEVEIIYPDPDAGPPASDGPFSP